MDRSIKIILFIIFFSVLSCKGQEDIEIKLTIYNVSGKVLDSIAVHDVFDKDTIYYNIKPNEIIEQVVKEKTSLLPKGERGVFSVTAFTGDYFYWSSTGFIGFPTTKLEKEYEVFIHEGFITEKKDFNPLETDQRKNIKDYHK